MIKTKQPILAAMFWGAWTGQWSINTGTGWELEYLDEAFILEQSLERIQKLPASAKCVMVFHPGLIETRQAVEDSLKTHPFLCTVKTCTGEDLPLPDHPEPFSMEEVFRSVEGYLEGS